MLILQAVWIEIRDEFTRDEMAALRAAAVGETICPRGLHVDMDQLDAELAEKLTTLILGRAKRR
jgi:hypothetical protein